MFNEFPCCEKQSIYSEVDRVSHVVVGHFATLGHNFVQFLFLQLQFPWPSVSELETVDTIKCSSMFSDTHILGCSSKETSHPNCKFRVSWKHWLSWQFIRNTKLKQSKQQSSNKSSFFMAVMFSFVCIMQHGSTAPQTAASRMIIQYNQHPFTTISIKTQHCKRHEGRIYNRTVALDCQF